MNALIPIAYYLVLGKPLLFYLGILTFLAFTGAAIMGYRVLHGKAQIKHHFLAIKIAFTIAIIHAILGISVYF